METRVDPVASHECFSPQTHWPADIRANVLVIKSHILPKALVLTPCSTVGAVSPVADSPLFAQDLRWSAATLTGCRCQNKKAIGPSLSQSAVCLSIIW